MIWAELFLPKLRGREFFNYAKFELSFETAQKQAQPRTPSFQIPSFHFKTFLVRWRTNVCPNTFLSHILCFLDQIHEKPW